jgi:hypothetical protein
MGLAKNSVAVSMLKGLCLFLSGIGVGWLIGLSVSPIIYVVITSLIAFVVSVTSALAGVKLNQQDEEDQLSPSAKAKRKFKVEVDPFPMTVMIIGLAIGASLGVYARTNNWLGARPKSFVERWKGTELSEKEISRRLFDQLYPAPITPEPTTVPPNAQPSETPTVTPDMPNAPDGKKSKAEREPVTANNSAAVLSGVLFSATVDECASFRTATNDDLRNQLVHLSGSSSEAENIRQQARACSDVSCLKRIVQEICRKPRSN